LAGAGVTPSGNMDLVAVTRNGDGGRNGNAKPGSVQSGNPSEALASRQEAADYIASMLEDLRRLAQQRDMAFLSYMIGLALEEAINEKARPD